MQNAHTAAIPMTKDVEVRLQQQQPKQEEHNSPTVTSSISSAHGDTVEEPVTSSCCKEKEGYIEQKPKPVVKPQTMIKMLDGDR